MSPFVGVYSGRVLFYSRHLLSETFFFIAATNFPDLERKAARELHSRILGVMDTFELNPCLLQVDVTKFPRPV